MKGGLAEEAGSALFWKALLQGGTHLIYLLRLLILARVLAPEDFWVFIVLHTFQSLFFWQEVHAASAKSFSASAWRAASSAVITPRPFLVT